MVTYKSHLLKKTTFSRANIKLYILEQTQNLCSVPSLDQLVVAQAPQVQKLQKSGKSTQRIPIRIKAATLKTKLINKTFKMFTVMEGQEIQEETSSTKSFTGERNK